MGRFINADTYTSTGQGFVGNNMFAYCNNNPVCLADPVGNVAKPYNRDLVGYGGGASPDIGLGNMLVGLLSTVFAVKNATPREDEKADVYVDVKTGQKKQYQYWKATLKGNKVVTGDGLTFVEASTRVAGGNNIMCANQHAAKWIIVVNGYWNAVGPEVGRGDGFFWHYHPHRDTNVHIWFYGGT